MQRLIRSKRLTRHELCLANRDIILNTEIALRKELTEFIELYAEEIVEKAVFSKVEEPITKDLILVLELRILDRCDIGIPSYHGGLYDTIVKSLPRAEFPEKEE